MRLLDLNYGTEGFLDLGMIPDTFYRMKNIVPIIINYQNL